LYELDVRTIEPFAEYIHIDQYLYPPLFEILHELFSSRSRCLAVYRHGIHSMLAVVRSDVSGMSDADGIDDTFLSVGIMPDTLVQPFDSRPFVEYGIHLLDLEVAVPTSLTQAVNQLLVVAVRFDGSIVEN